MKTKRLLMIIITNLLISGLVLAQSPSSFKYQAVLRDASGNIKANANTNVRIDILQGGITGTNVYAETFTIQTNVFGLINLEIGSGIMVSGNFSTIDWSTGPYFVKVSIDGSEMGTSQLLSVPYALFAAKAGNVFSGNYNDLTYKPTILNASNTATGINVLKNVTGINNTANGYGALQADLTGNANTAFGFYSLKSNTSGSNNTAVGSMALVLDTSGDSNTAIGVQSLYYNTNGANNSAVGLAALLHNITGTNNTAVGGSTLYNNTTLSYNIAIGGSSFITNTTGSNNTVIGYSADASTDNLTNVTALGYGAKVSASNNMVFGNQNVVGWGFGVASGAAAIKVGSTSNNGNGATLTTGGVWTNASDSAKKYNIQPIQYGLKEVLKLRPVSYQMKGSGYQDIGFIAQEVKLLLPELVYGKEGDLSLSYGQITAVLTKAMQEQQKQMEVQQKQINELKQLVEKLAKK